MVFALENVLKKNASSAKEKLKSFFTWVKMRRAHCEYLDAVFAQNLVQYALGFIEAGVS